MSDDLRTRLEAALGSAYRIERELGGGGMSRVFLAEEVELRRKVVVKVLPPEMAAGVNQDRFRREIQLAAGLQHPHIVPVHSAGSSGDLLWYTMPYIEGESLRTRLTRGGELPVKEALLILREVADALAYAHGRGVVHRDIKPDNVMLSGKHALVTDFGVAKAVSESTGRQSLTSLGVALGTPSYMAPEQAAAEPNVDHRADVYALGAMAYEMLAGRPPFTGMSAQAVLAAHVTQTPEPVTGLRPAIPAALGGLVMRCLEKRPADRWQTADELVPHLEALLTPSGGTAPTVATSALSSGTEAAVERRHPVRVTVLFALGSAAALTLTWWLVRQIGLPDWVVLAAGALLLVGLPIVLIAARRDRQRLVARTQGLPVAQPTSLAGRLMTLRGAIAGGALAFVGLAIGAGGFMALRAAGVGPFATLMSSGAIGERDPIILADFENRTADSLLGESVTEALRIDLTRSTVVRIAGQDGIAETLRRMERDPETPLTPAVAREVAERSGVAAVLFGEITPLGAGFSLSARIVSVPGGETLLAERESADDAGGIIGAVDRLSRKLREGIGESLRTIRAGQPLEEVTTGSLEALRVFTQADRVFNKGDYDEAERRLKEAIAIDSGFAMAWRKLAVVYSNTGQSSQLIHQAAGKAFQLRDRLPERERLLATAYYYYEVQYDPERVIDANRQVLARWPEDRNSLNNLALALNEARRYQEAEPLVRQMVQLHPDVAVGYVNLVVALAHQGKNEAVDSVLAALPATLGRDIRFDISNGVFFARGEYDRVGAAAESLLALGEGTPQFYGRFWRASVSQVQGRMTAARRTWRLQADRSFERGLYESGIGNVIRMARIEAGFLGRRDQAFRTLDSVLAEHPLGSVAPEDRPYIELARFHYEFGDPAGGDALLAEYDREVPEAIRSVNERRWHAEAMAALARNDPKQAIELLLKYRAGTWSCPLCGLMELGMAWDALNQPDSALAAYQAIHTTPTLGREWTGSAGQGALMWSLAPSSIRLGELYETRGDKAKALEYYGKFVDLWKDADPELQPRVREIRQRIGQLAGEPGAR